MKPRARAHASIVCAVILVFAHTYVTSPHAARRSRGAAGLASLPSQAPAKGVTIQVVDPTGNAIHHAAVSVSVSASPKAVSGESDERGFWHANEIAAGEYRVNVSAAGFKDAVLEHVILPATGTIEVELQPKPVVILDPSPALIDPEESPITLKLEPPKPAPLTAGVSLKVTGLKNLPLRDVKIELINEATGHDWIGRTDESGAYTFTQIPVGRYRVVLTSNGFKSYVKDHLAIPSKGAIRAQLQPGLLYEDSF